MTDPIVFEMTIKANRSGHIKHMIKADSHDAAKQRIHRAYPDQEITFVETNRLICRSYPLVPRESPPS